MLYRRSNRYLYKLGFLGYLLAFLCIAYVFIWVSYFVVAYLPLAPNIPQDQEFLSGLLTWSALKPFIVLLILLCLVFSLYDPMFLTVLCVSCGVIWVGTVMLGIDLIVIRATECNSQYFPNSACNDLLYCCAYYDRVPSCSGLGPCPGANVTTPSDLSVNNDFYMTGIFTGIFFGLEVMLVVVSFASLTRMKNIYKDLVVTNDALQRYYDGNLTSKYEATLGNLSQLPPSPPSAKPPVTSSPSAKSSMFSTVASSVGVTIEPPVAVVVATRAKTVDGKTLKMTTITAPDSSKTRSHVLSSSKAMEKEKESTIINMDAHHRRQKTKTKLKPTTPKISIVPSKRERTGSNIVGASVASSSLTVEKFKTTTGESPIASTPTSKRDGIFLWMKTKGSAIAANLASASTELSRGTSTLFDRMKSGLWGAYVYAYYHIESFAINEMVHKPLESRNRLYKMKIHSDRNLDTSFLKNQNAKTGNIKRGT